MITFIRQAAAALYAYRKLWYGLYATKLALALIITVPGLILIQARTDYSQFSRPLLSSWSLDVIGELIATNPNRLSTGVAILVFFAILVFLIKQFVNGGIYGTFWHRDPLTRETFFSRSGRQFGTQVVISIGMLPIYVMLLLLGGLLAWLVGRLWHAVMPSTVISGTVVRTSALYLVLSIGVVFSDLVRLRQAAVPGEKLTKSFSAAYHFYRRHFLQSMGLFLAFFVPFVLLWLIVEGLALAVTGSLGNILGIAIEFILFQLCSFARVGQSLLVTGALAGAYRHQTEPVPTPTSYEASVDGATLLP